MARRSSSTTRRTPNRSSRGSGAGLPARLGIWIAIAVGLCGAVYLGHKGIRHLFFSGNPHFIVKNIEVTIEKGAISEERVRERLAATEESDNLFALSLGGLRSDLLNDPIIQEAEVRRKLPSTLTVHVYGRTPVAQLQRNSGPLIDSEGIVLPPSELRETLTLPVITGIPGLTSNDPGKPINNETVAAALQLLRYRDTISDGHWFDVDFIQLDESAGELRLLLRAKPQLLIRDGCMVTVPIEGMREAMQKGIAVISQRAKAHQPTGSLNLTYEKVPATP